MKILLGLVICCELAGQAVAARLQPANFRQHADVGMSLKGGTLYRIDLPADVLRGCAPGQPDIRLFAPDGSEVPYSLVRAEYLKKADETYAAEITGYKADERDAVLEFRLNGQFSPVNSVELAIADRDFRKDAELFGSDDGKTWTRLVSGSIYDFSSQVDLRQTKLKFAGSSNRFYRLKLRDTEEPQPQGKTVSLKYDGIDFSVSGGKGKKLRIDGVKAGTGGQNSLIGAYDEAVFQPVRAGEGKDNSSYFYIERGLPFEKVSFSVSDAFFVRDFSAWYSETGEEGSYRGLGGSNIYRFPSGWQQGERTVADISSPGHRFYKFIFNNRNNPPLRIMSVKLSWLKRSLYFIAPVDMTGLTLAFDRANTQRPSYDTESFINQGNWEKRTAQELKLGVTAPTTNYSPDPAADRKTRAENNILTGVIVLVVAGMGYWLYTLLKKAAVKLA